MRKFRRNVYNRLKNAYLFADDNKELHKDTGLKSGVTFWAQTSVLSLRVGGLLPIP